MKHRLIGFARLVLAATLALSLSACFSSQYTRGMFQGYVMDQTQEVVTDKIGKPDEIDGSDGKGTKWTYRKKTFDPENMNAIDDTTVLHFELKGGKLVVTDVSYG